MKKFPDILRPLLTLLVIAVYLTASAGSLVHEVVHAGSARVDIRSGHDHGSTVTTDDGTSFHDTTTTCPFCLAGPLVLMIVTALLLMLIERADSPRSPRLPGRVVRQSFLTPSFRAPPFAI